MSCVFNGTTSTFPYGADGLRRSATVGGVTTYYVYDGQTLIREMMKNAQGAFYNTVTYLTGPRGPECRIDETQQTEGYYNPADASPRPVHARGVTKWYVYDGLGSVVGEMDPSGNLTSSPKYDVYGLVRSNGGTASSKMGFVGGLGHLSEANTGLIYMRARYYDPNNGRFNSQDPGRHGVNWFVYASDSPTNRIDYSGKSDDVSDIVNWLLLAAAGGIVGNLATNFVVAFAKAIPLMAGYALQQLGLTLMTVGDGMIESGKASETEGDTLIKEAEAIDASSDAGFIAARNTYQAGAMGSIGGAAEVAMGVTMQSIGEYAYGIGLGLTD